MGARKQSTSVTVSYLVPVYVVINNDGNGPYVDKVVVDDSVSFHGRRDGLPCNDAGEALPITNAAVIEAYDHAENGDDDWPAWEFGW